MKAEKSMTVTVVPSNTSRFEDVPLAIGQHIQRGDESPPLPHALLLFYQNGLSIRRRIDQNRFPLDCLPILVDGPVEGGVASKTAIHFHCFVWLNAEPRRDHFCRLRAQLRRRSCKPFHFASKPEEELSFGAGGTDPD